jgi:hypothetical protein
VVVEKREKSQHSGGIYSCILISKKICSYYVRFTYSPSELSMRVRERERIGKEKKFEIKKS